MLQQAVKNRPPANGMSMDSSPVTPHLSSAAQDGRVTVGNRIELSYIDRGAGHPIILIPGWSFTKEVFEKQIPFLSQTHRVIAYDPRGQGMSTNTAIGNDYTTHGEDLAALIDALAIKNPILVGWSAGAHTAWAYTKLRGAASIAAMVAIDVPPKCLSHDEDAWVAGSLDEIAAVHTVYLRDAKGQASFIRRYSETAMIERSLQPEELAWLIAQSATTKPLIAAQLFASFMFGDHTAEAITVARTRPTLYYLSQGAAKKALPFIKRMLPETRHVVFGGHMMFWEHPEAFNLVLDEFIRLHVNLTAPA